MGSNANRESVFRFRQFDVSDRMGAMKIGTDGVLLGAWAPVDGVKSAVDVGSGTGLISLMLAQRGVPEITAIEIEPGAAAESRMNVSNSPWAQKIRIVEGDATAIDLKALAPDLIVSNPPYFSSELRSPQQKRALARHGDTLNFSSLAALGRTLAPHGKMAFISPIESDKEIEFALSLNSLYVAAKTYMRFSPSHAPKRILWLASQQVSPVAESMLTIRDSANNLTPDYKALVGDFYLNI